MKKYMLLLPNAIYPYIFMVVFLVVVILNQVLSVISAEGFSVICARLMPIMFLAGLICNIIFMTKAIKMKWDARKLLKANRILKWVQFPANIIYISYSSFMVLKAIAVIKEGVADNIVYKAGSILCIVILNLMLYLVGALFSGFVAIAAIVRAKSEGLITKRIAVFCGICSFLVIVDVITAQILYNKGKRENG